MYTALESVAILQVTFEKLQKDYIENFVPFVAYSLHKHNVKEVSAIDLQRYLLSDFGVQLPVAAINLILKRCKNKGMISYRNGSYTANQPKIKTVDFETSRRTVQTQNQILINDLVKYVDETFKLEWDPQSAEAALQAYISDYKLDLLKATESNEPIVPIVPSVPSPAKNNAYVVGSFARYLQETGASSWQALEQIVKGNMIANALYLPDPTTPLRRFGNTSVYFDTTFLIYALYSSTARRTSSLELIDLLKLHGARLYCFHHTLLEIQSALYSCATQLAAKRPFEKVRWEPNEPNGEA